MSIQKVPEKNAVFFEWFNQYSGILLKTQTKTFAIDPVDIKPKHLKNIDIILLTHEQYDHLDTHLVKETQKTTNCTIIADPASAFRLKPHIPIDKLQVMRIGDTTKIGEVTIKAVKCNHEARYPNTYIITSEDGVKIYHTSDSLPFPELAKIGLDEKFDLVFCSVGIAKNASPESGFEIARLTKPPLAVPYHTNSPTNQKTFQQLIKKELPRTACLIPEINKIYQISKIRQNHHP